jgi:hypothetical protein
MAGFRGVIGVTVSAFTAILSLGAVDSASAKGGSPSFYLNDFAALKVKPERARRPLLRTAGVLYQSCPSIATRPIWQFEPHRHRGL